MYNLFVSADGEAWNGEPVMFELSRSVREYTDDCLTDKYGSLDDEAIRELKKLPCLFMCEARNNRNVKFGYIKDIIARSKEVKITYELIHTDIVMTYDEFESIEFELGISGKWEMWRHHWAVKDVDLNKYLSKVGIKLPSFDTTEIINLKEHQFDVALSFAGEYREYVKNVYDHLDNQLGKNSVFYDNSYKSQLAVPNLTYLLSDIYKERTNLIVVFYGQKYNDKPWCGLEYGAINTIRFNDKHTNRIMYIKMDAGTVDGILETDGYIDASHDTSEQVAKYILERLELLKKS